MKLDRAVPPALRKRSGPSTAWFVAAAAMFVCGWGGNQFTPLLSMYRSVNGFSTTVVDALLGAYVLGLAPALLVGGPLSDRHGRRPVMLVALTASGLGSTLLAVGALPVLFAGRLLCGVAVGLGMAVGTSWVTELTVAGGLPPASGARRASLSLTAGFGVGAGVAGVLAQWSPQPETVPYLVHLVAAVAVLAAVIRWCPDTRVTVKDVALWVRLRAPSLRHPRFRRLVLPMAPWVFGAAGVAYAIVPQSLAHQMGHWSLIYATALTVITLGSGVLIQPLARRLDHPQRPRAILAAMVALPGGIALAAYSVAVGSPWLGALAAAVLGASYGVALVAGLLEIQRTAAVEELPALTGVYYAVSYIGFLFPTALALAARWMHTDVELIILALVALACTFVIAAGRCLPAGSSRPGAGTPALPTGRPSGVVRPDQLVGGGGRRS